MSKNKKMESSDPYEINARKRNIENFKAELAKLRAEQEAQQAANTYSNMYKMGGRLPKYFGGGPLAGSLDSGLGGSLLSSSGVADSPIFTDNTFGMATNPLEGIGSAGVAGGNQSLSKYLPGILGMGLQLGSSIGSYVSNRKLAKHYQNLADQPLEKIDPIENLQTQQALEDMASARQNISDYGTMDIKPMLANAERQAKIAQANAKTQAAGGGPGAVTSNIGALASQKERAIRDIYSQKALYEDQARLGKGQAFAGLGQAQYGIGQTEREEGARTQGLNFMQEANRDKAAEYAAQYRNMAGTGFWSDLGGAGNQAYMMNLASRSMPYSDFGSYMDLFSPKSTELKIT